MEVLNLLNTDPELLKALFMDQKARTGKKLLAKKPCQSLDGCLETLTCLMNTGNNWLFYINENVMMNKLHTQERSTQKEFKALYFTPLTQTKWNQKSLLLQILWTNSQVRSTMVLWIPEVVPKMLWKIEIEGAYQKCLDEMQNNTTNSLLSKNKNRKFEKALRISRFLLYWREKSLEAFLMWAWCQRILTKFHDLVLNLVSSLLSARNTSVSSTFSRREMYMIE